MRLATPSHWHHLLVTLLTRLGFNNLPYATHYSKSLASRGKNFVSNNTNGKQAEPNQKADAKKPAEAG